MKNKTLQELVDTEEYITSDEIIPALLDYLGNKYKLETYADVKEDKAYLIIDFSVDSCFKRVRVLFRDKYIRIEIRYHTYNEDASNSWANLKYVEINYDSIYNTWHDIIRRFMYIIENIEAEFITELSLYTKNINDIDY